MNKDRFSAMRILPIISILFSMLLSTWVMCFFNQFYLDEILSVIFLDILFFLIFVFELEYERKQKKISNNTETTFTRVAVCFFICCLSMIAFSFLPEFVKPVMLIPILMSGAGNVQIAISVSLYLNFLFSLINGGNSNELIAYCLLSLLAAMLSEGMVNRKYRIEISLLFFFLGFLIPCIFYYLTFKEISNSFYLYCLLDGMLIVFITLLFYGHLREGRDKEVEHRLIDLIQADFALVKEVAADFPLDYNHARRVSTIAAHCAERMGYDVLLCEVAGFYYHMGDWIGEPIIDNAVARAQKYCFPESLIQILREYNGVLQSPSTPESALVHMVDALVLKLEVLSQEVGKSHWNRDMVIYQTLDEFSSAGLYDKSSMSINHFLRIREYLTKEEHLI